MAADVVSGFDSWGSDNEGEVREVSSPSKKAKMRATTRGIAADSPQKKGKAGVIKSNLKEKKEKKDKKSEKKSKKDKKSKRRRRSRSPGDLDDDPSSSSSASSNDSDSPRGRKKDKRRKRRSPSGSPGGSPSGSSSSSSSGSRSSSSTSEDTKRRRLRHKKEQSKIKEFTMPNTSSFNKFKFTLYDRVQECALNKTDREVTTWINKAFDKDISYERLGKVRSAWVGINRKLIVALNPLIHGPFGRGITEEEQRLVKSNKSRLTALQILRRLQNHLETNPEMKEVYSIQDIMDVVWIGDQNKALFRHNWNTKVTNVGDAVSMKTLAGFLFERLKESKDLAVPMNLHKSKYRGHEHKAESPEEVQERYDDMMGILNEAINEEQRNKNRNVEIQAGKKSNSGKGDGTPATPGVKGGGGKDKGDGKGKKGGKGGGKEKGKKGKDKGDGKGKKGGKQDGKRKGYGDKVDASILKLDNGKRLCVFFQNGTCNDKDCQCEHAKASTPQQQSVAQKIRDQISVSRSATPARNAAPAPEAKAKGKAKARPRRGRSSSRGPAADDK